MDSRAILSLAAGYRLFGKLVGAHRQRVDYVKRYIRPKAGDKVLDCGCGPGDFLEYLPDVDYVGIDISEDYIKSARRRFGNRATFRVGSVGRETMSEEGHYDLVLAIGLLHHLDDHQAGEFLRVARRCLKPTGRLVTLDGCYTDGQSRAVRFFLDRDRGSHVRSMEAWLRLLQPVFPEVQAHLRHDMLRIPYTHLIMECPVADTASARPETH